ncbi:DUF4331 family protein [Stieleria varia]|uniref:DUF4331 domain-containing protein n=1 Tax=Stieleria varia TaxID=2528005 RepID=A0A5C6B9R5_9BACT|nr:DUF4331 family protein [Stieleria varia]TWU08006.1 hypothetical protein Pla52n_05840 [Stieleria varia]
MSLYNHLRSVFIPPIAAGTLMLLLMTNGHVLFAADHLDSPSVTADGSLDINDVYAFQSPANPANTVLIVTVNPGAGMISGTAFNSRSVYEINVDNTGDAIADVRYDIYFTRVRNGSQTIRVYRENGALIASGSTGQTISVTGGGQVTANLFEDPFFFDLNGFNNGFAFTGDDFFAGLNVSAIVLEVPSTDLNGASTNVGVWARTVNAGSQFDRMGRPAINTALISTNALKDQFNASLTQNDPQNFGAEVAANITALSSPANAAALTPILLPDVLTFDTSSAAGFLNGRRLGDDVIDAELGLLTEGAVTTDMVNENDATFLNVFPYLAAPN